MKIRVPEYFSEFKCIASDCEDTCCAGWGIVIDDETYKHYKNVEGEFGERLRNEIVHEAGENIFVLKGNNCPFLSDNKLCDIYKELGEDGLCYTCKQYPRYMEEFGSLREIGISLSCPEAARIILRDSKKVIFPLTKNDEIVNTYNEINAKLFMELMQCRNIVMNTLQNRTININIRAAIVLKFVKEIQDKIDASDIIEIKEVKEKYTNEDFINKLIDSLQSYKNKEIQKYDSVYKYFRVFKDLKHINQNDPLGLEDGFRYFWNTKDDEELYILKHKEFNMYYKENEYKFENILVYFVFRYFMKAVYDYDALAKIKTAIISYIMIKELSVIRWIENNQLTYEDIVDISQRYSKDVEHLEENIETLAELFETNDEFTVEQFLYVLMN